jgi:hypothetical protein
MTSELLKRTKIISQDELPDGRELILVDMQGFDIITPSPRFVVFERRSELFILVCASDDEDVAKTAYDSFVDEHKEKKVKRH